MKDKIKHGLVGAGVGFFVGILAYLTQQDDAGNVANSAAWDGAIVAVLVAAIGGGIKEFCDMQADGNKWDWWDFAATVIGGVVAAILVLAIHFGRG